jgi:arylsulfatase A-like enzyme
MKRRDFLRSTLMAGTCLATGCDSVKSQTMTTPSGAEQKAKPNVILIMTDDQGYGDLACHGNPVLKTPNLDRLYAQSTRLTDFHVAPFCSPTRAALMTGRLPERVNVWSTLYGRNHLERKETTMAEFFKASGYATGQFGKWHIGANYPYRPMDRGFDQWVGLGNGGLRTTSDYWANDRMNDHYLRNGKWEPFRGFGADVFFDETMAFIKTNTHRPFFAYLATNIPHGPCHILDDWEEKYEQYSEGPAWGSVGDFLTSIARFDYNLGRLRTCLVDNNLADNTILIFLTDNGTAQGAGIFNAGMRGGKGSVYDGGHRVPCFIHWPAGGFKQPRDIDDLTSCTDLLPTLVDLCGLKLPKRGHLELDGLSLASILAGKTPAWTDRTIIHHVQNIAARSTKWRNTVVLTPQWRLINGKQLFDIKNDPSQRKDIAQENAAVVADLRQRYEAYWDSLDTNQQLRHPARPIIGSAHQDEVCLTSIDWIQGKGPHTWNQSHVLNADAGSGYWPVEIASAGKYRFEVRRWPREVNKPITAVLPAQTKSDTVLKGKPWTMGPGKAIEAVNVKLRVGETIIEKPITDHDKYAGFSVDLPAGHTQIQAWLLDRDQNTHGAYYVYVERL